jgi:D-beta-D-heptose 7-phosphate kinase/D-beta-D-heptose 1-phosphate adenosyltransferase
MSIPAQKQFNILLLGDSCRDIYQFGTVDRMSPEAPVPVFVPSYREERDGMASNVFKNLEALGCDVNYLFGETSVKTRLIDSRSRQQIVRIDDDVESEPMTFETAIPPGYDAIVISDYNKGLITYELVEELRREFSGPIFVDTKKQDLARFEGCIVKINQVEHTARSSNCSNMIVTQGKQGALYNNKMYPAAAIDVIDVCGAGDTFLAALAYEYLNTDGNMEAAVEFAIRASAVTVQHTGVYAPTLEEIQC